MGLLTSGEPLSWNETQKYAEYVREHGIIQFINVYNRLRDRQDEFLKWGDEVEYMLVRFDHVNQKARLSLKAEPILGEMNEREAQEKQKPNATLASLWRPEFGAFMVEGTPGVPYGDLCKDLTKVEDNMRFRRREIEALLEPDEALLCLTSFPRLGTDDFTWPKAKLDPKNSPTGSIFIPDEAIFGGHPRFRTLARNIRQRRKRRVIINIPIFLDEKTPRPFIEQFDDEEAKKAVKENHIYMDHMCFGMGCCCLQVTFQASNLGEARNLYDQLTPLCPILLALSAASPIHRGLISGLDCRWTVIAQSVDDRTKEELNEEPLKDCKFRINKSRYDSVDSYLSEAGEKYSNIPLVYDRKYYQKMIEGNVDPIMARHIAHLFIRDPISLYKEKLDQDDTIDMDHFENIQSTNWQTMRFKPPPSSEPNIGWRVEFRPMEIQLTEFENAAFVVFIVLLTRVILTYSLNLLIPLSKVDENMVEAQKEDAINKCRFWFRKDISLKKACEVSEESNDTRNPNIETANSDIDTDHQNDNYMVKMSVDEIINGKPGHFPGLRFFLNKYLLDSQMEAETQCWINQYLNLISFKAAGKAQTTAKWIREFVMNHPDYKKDSVVSDKVNYDLLKEIDAMTKGKVRSRSLLPDEIQIKNSPNSTKFTK